MDQIDHSKGCNDLDLTEDGTGSANGTRKWGGSQHEAAIATVQAEIARVSQLPSNSSYAVHRLRVLNKLLYLTSIQRTIAQDEELELLFESLSL